MSAGERRRGWPAVAVAAVGLVAVSVAQCVPNRHSMEDDLTARSVAALRDADLTQVRVSFSGRDATLMLPSPAGRDRALAIVLAQTGVRTAEAIVTTPDQNGTTAPTVVLAIDAGHAVLTGVVPSESAREILVDAAVAAFGADAVQDDLSIDESVSDAGLAGLGEMFNVLGVETTGAKVTLGAGVVTLTGTVTSPATKADALAAAAKATGSTAAVVDQLRVVAPQPSPTSTLQSALADLPTVTFHSGSATLTAQGEKVVARVEAILRDHPEVRVRIEGHTDATGTAAANLVLSRERAQTVLDALRARGIAADRLSAVGYGESRLKVPDTTPENRAINRRVEFVVLS